MIRYIDRARFFTDALCKAHDLRGSGTAEDSPVGAKKGESVVHASARQSRHLINRRAALCSLGGAAVGACAPGLLRAAAPLRLRASIDSTAQHSRTVGLRAFLTELERRTNGAIKAELYDSGQLFADRDVTRALLQGQVEMAMPGTWVLAGVAPDNDLLQLPLLYSSSIATVHKVIDGRAGELINQALESKLGVHVLGKWLDLGFCNWYTTKRSLTSYQDLRGLKLRNSGGAGQAWRATFFGAIPNTTSWPDVPLSLSQGTFDGLATTDESVVSIRLWEAGLRYAFIDHQFMSEYVPLVSGAFWSALSSLQKDIMSALWEENIGAFRAKVAEQQEAARAIMEKQGIRVVIPGDAEVLEVRQRMLTEQAQLSSKLRIRPEVVSAAEAAIVAAG